MQLSNRIRFATVLIGLVPAWVGAQSTPAGLWETHDEHTKQPSSHVRITESNGMLTGVIEEILDPAKADARCTECQDARRDQPIKGMVFIREVPPADEPLTWQGGEVLDPKTGNTYKVRIRLQDEGKALEVRGYKGTPMFGRTQVWQRVPEAAPSPAKSGSSADPRSTRP